MSILPLPQFEADLEEYQRELEAHRRGSEGTKTLVVRFGRMKLIGEYPFDSSIKPGCGSKVVVKTHRGTELAEVLTSTCPNAGCGKSVSRQQIREYIENSGGKDYPFYDRGRVLRIATMDDLDAQSAQEQACHAYVRQAKGYVRELGLPIKVVAAEWLLGKERLIYFFLSEDRVDTRALHHKLAQQVDCRVMLQQVGARDEARLIADYERCGQYCCCKNFLKVLKPISMRSAKTQKATLEPLKISGRCGRLMCCLRYEDETYEALRKRLPHRKSRVGTPHGDGMVIKGQILTQLVLIALDNGERVAVPVEELTAPVLAKAPRREDTAVGGGRSGGRVRSGDKRRGRGARDSIREKRDENRTEADEHDQATSTRRSKKKVRKKRKDHHQLDDGLGTGQPRSDTQSEQGMGRVGKKKRRRKRKKRHADGETGEVRPMGSTGNRPDGSDGNFISSDQREPGQNAAGESTGSESKKKRRRKRRRKKPPSSQQGQIGSGGDAPSA